MEAFAGIVQNVDDFVWGWTLIVLILATGIYLSIRTGFVQVLHLGKALKFMVQNEEDGEGEVTSFGALCTALSATVGTGNIVGVATALCVGGPGALFWMLVAAFFGMATKYSEGLLAILYREDRGNNHYLGGPFLYIEKGMGPKWKWLGKLFALFGALAGLLGIGTMTQINGITSAIEGFFDPNKSNIVLTLGEKDITLATIIGGAIVTLGVALVVIGGIKRIASVSEKIVPFMCVLYVVIAFAVIIINIKAIPAAIVLVITTAFSSKAAAGAVVGTTIKLAMQKGIGRGIFSNEAGLGSAPIAAAAAKTNEPVRQGLVTMTGTFIDTIIICTMTGLSIIVTGAYKVDGLAGAAVTTYAWQQSLSFLPSSIPALLVMACLALFAFTTILGWDYYSERCVEYLTNGNKTALMIFRILYIVAVFAGPYLALDVVWNIADIFNGLMAFPNLIALIVLGGVVGKETKSYFERHKNDKDSGKTVDAQGFKKAADEVAELETEGKRV